MFRGAAVPIDIAFIPRYTVLRLFVVPFTINSAYDNARSGRTPTRKSSSPAFLLSLFFFYRGFSLSLLQARRFSLSGVLFPLSKERRERRIRRGTHLKVSGRVFPDRRARSTQANTLRSVGCEASYSLDIYPGFCIADKVLATLGEGTFGKVVKVKDLQM